jgi:mannose-6-phosphate isomerase
VLYPFTFHSIFKERVWGGRKLERLYKKNLPPRAPIGESWEISDRPNDESIITNGPLAGNDLHWLMENHARELLGDAKPAAGNRFPLLCKILDARERLSLQVHPPADKAAERGGEPKTEMWFIADAAPGAELFAGLKRGVTRAEFAEKIQTGEVAGCCHRIPVHAGDAMFLPGGRVHTIGAGLVIFEIQQNSDTTYRVFDWNRVGLDGKPRERHVAQSLASIDFSDFEPALVQGRFAGDEVKTRLLVKDLLFNVEAVEMQSGSSGLLKPKKLQIVAVTAGEVEIKSGLERGRLVRAMHNPELADEPSALLLSAGQFCLVPACLEQTEIVAKSGAALLRVEAN